MARDHVPESTGEARSLWLEARLGKSCWVFELTPTEDRAIVVGSLLRAHIRIDRKGIFPVHFHFEREGDSGHLVPAYRGDLFVDGVPVSTPRRIEDAGVIDFSGTQLFVRIVSDPTLLTTDVDARGWEQQRALEQPASRETLSDWAELTVSALPSSGALDSGADTRALAPLCDVHLSTPVPVPFTNASGFNTRNGAETRAPQNPHRAKLALVLNEAHGLLALAHTLETRV
jgi:hypothetical protein